MLGVSLLPPRDVRRVALVGFLGSRSRCCASPSSSAAEIKGARRWINSPASRCSPRSSSSRPSRSSPPGCSPSSAGRTASPATSSPIVLYVVVLGAAAAPARCRHGAGGQRGLVRAVLPGRPAALLGRAARRPAASPALVGAYFVFPHVASRIDRFLDPGGRRHLPGRPRARAFINGGLFGRGPGEGTVKAVLPDAHADFIFAVAGEEFGLLALPRHRRAVRLHRAARLPRACCRRPNLFVLLAVAGLLIQFGLQALINMGSACT